MLALDKLQTPLKNPGYCCELADDHMPTDNMLAITRLYICSIKTLPLWLSVAGCVQVLHGFDSGPGLQAVHAIHCSARNCPTTQ